VREATGDGGRAFPGPAYPLGANPSFADLVGALSAEPAPFAGAAAPAVQLPVAHGTTVLALRFDDGVVMAGDRRAVEGFSIADERIEKVFPADEYSTVAIAGVAGLATEMVRLFQTELEHYEKVEGDRLSLEGKANRLAQMIRGNFAMALQGLAVVPLFAGYDLRRGEGRIFRYDVTGGRWEEADYHATGSGGVHARASLKKRWRPGIDRDGAVRAAVEALFDASQEDAATGGPNVLRGVFPSVKVVDAAGVQPVSDDELRAIAEDLQREAVDAAKPVSASPAREVQEPPEASSGGPGTAS